MSGELFFKSLFSAVAFLLTFAAFLPYYRNILRGRTRAHVFSWIIWGGGTVIVAFAQLAEGAGVGGWPTLLSGALTCGIAGLAYLRRGDLSITRSDWFCLLLAASALPFWFATDSPLIAVLILTTVDLLGFGPSLRKAWILPEEENLLFFGIAIVRNGFMIAALEQYNLTTLLFPLAVLIASLGFVCAVGFRRLSLSKKSWSG